MGPAPARLSPLDAAFLYFERPHQRLYAGCVAILDGAPGFAAFANAVEQRVCTLPRYRRLPVRATLDLGLPRWEEDPRFEVRRHVRHIAVPPPGDDAALEELVDSLFATQLDPDHPLWEAYLIEGLAGGRSAVLCKVHHSMTDGVSGAQLLDALFDPLPGAPPHAAAESAAHDVPRRSGLWPALRALADPQTAWAHAREAAEVARVATSLFWQGVPQLPFNGPLGDARRVAWAAFPLDDFLAMRGTAGAKVNEVVLAVIAGALRRYLLAHGEPTDAGTVRALVPISPRREEHVALGNLLSAAFPTLPVDEPDPIARLERIRSETRAHRSRARDRASGFLPTLAASLPPALAALFARLSPDRPLVNTVCTNVPGPRQARRLAGCRVVDMHPIVPLLFGMGLEFATLSYADRISICAAADPQLVPDAARIPDHLRAAAEELQSALALRAQRPTVEGLRVADLMTIDVVTVTPEHTLGEAWDLMREHHIRHLPVVDEAGRLVGLVTHRDLLAAATSSLTFPAEHDRVFLLGGHRVAEVMETHLSTATADDPAPDVGERMARHRIGCVPVVDTEGRLVGIVTETDYLHWATARMEATTAAARAGS